MTDAPRRPVTKASGSVIARIGPRPPGAELGDPRASLAALEWVTDPAVSRLAPRARRSELLERLLQALAADVVLLVVREEGEANARIEVRRGVDGPGGLAEAHVGGALPPSTCQWIPTVDPQRGWEWALAAGLRGLGVLAAAPLPLKGDPGRGPAEGVVVAGWQEGRQLVPTELRLLEVVADRVSAAFEHERLDEARNRSGLGARHAQLHLRVLARGGSVLGTAFDTYDGALRALGDVVVPEFADWFAAHVAEDGGALRCVTSVGPRPGGLQPTVHGSDGEPGAAAEEIVRMALRERRPQVVFPTARLGRGDLPARVHEPESGWAKGTSVIAVPVRVRDAVTGVLSFGTAAGRRGFRPSDLDMASELAQRVGVSLERVAAWRASAKAGETALRYAERLRTLVEAALVVNAELSEHELLTHLAEHAGQVLGAAAVVVLGGEPGHEESEHSWLPDGALWTGDDRVTEVVRSAARACRGCDGARRGGGGAPARRSWLAVPLGPGKVSPRRLVVAVGAPSAPFNDEDEAVLTLLARMASVALSNASLYEDVRGNSQRLEAVLDSSPVAIVELSPAGGAKWWNKAARALFGWSLSDVAPPIPVDDVTRSILTGLWERAREGHSTSGVMMNCQAGTDHVLRLSVSTSPLFEQNEVSGMLVVADDITERLRILEQFHQAERLGAVNRMAGAVAHDFNNLLTVIFGCTDVLMRGLRDDEALMQEVAAIKRAGLRAADLTTQLVRIGRPGHEQPEHLCVDDAVVVMERMLAGALGERIDLVTDLRTPGIRVLIDRSDLERSALNLAVNARDAMPDGGELTITTRLVGGADDEPSGVLLAFADNGSGMDTATVERCLEPFFTTKGRARGTGLGLAMVHAMTIRAGGSISVESAPGHGARFAIWLPVSDAPTRAASQQSPAPAPVGRGPRTGAGSPVTGGGAVVLFVEDDEELSRVAVRELESDGFRVVAVGTGDAALSAVESLEGAVDLVVTDVVMPGMSGLELARIVNQRYPDIPVILCSGHLEEDADGGPHLPEHGEVLFKPFDGEELIERVRSALAPALK